MGFKLDNCCCCIELKTGSLIIGYLSLVWTIILTALSAIGVIALGAILGSSDKFDPEKQEQTTNAVTIALIILVLVLIFLIINLVFVIILLVGLHQEKRGHVKAYLIYNGIYLVISAVLLIVGIATGSGAGEIVKNLISLGLGIYFLLVIRSYYFKMDDATKKPAIYNTA